MGGKTEKKSRRIFLCVDVPENLKRKIVSLRDELLVEGMVPVPETNMHITLYFFGEISEEKISFIEKRIKDQLNNIESFQVSLKNVGVFPTIHKPKVVFVSVESEELKRLGESLKKEFDEGSNKEFSPHVTLARVKNNFGEVSNIIKNFRSENLGEFNVDEVLLKESNFVDKVAVHTTLRKFKINNRDK